MAVTGNMPGGRKRCRTCQDFLAGDLKGETSPAGVESPATRSLAFRSGRATRAVLTKLTMTVLALVLLASPCRALVDTIVVEKSGCFLVPLVNEFGMAAGGLVKFEFEAEASFPRGIGYIVVVGEDAASGWYDPIIKNNGVCNNSSDDPPSVCMSPAVARFEVQETATFNFTINQYDLYNAYFIVCRSDSHVSARITSTFVNLDPEGGLTQHLAIELAMLPPLFAVIAAVAACLAMAWTVEMTRLRKFVLQIHYYCLAAIWLKTIAAILVAAYIQKQSKDGHGHLPLRVIATLAQNLSQVVFLLTLLLLSLGMSIIHPILPRREAWPVALVFVMYGGLSTGHAFCENSQGWLCNSLALMEYAVRCLVMLSTVVAINFNITNIRFNIQLPWTSSSALEYLKLEQFLAYRMTYVAYLLLPTALLIVRLSVLSWHYNWVFSTLDEFLKLVIYAYIGTTFAPLDTWLLTRAFDDRLDER